MTVLLLLTIPRVLASLLQQIDWLDLHSFLNSCSPARILFRSPDLRDLILARFVPGYQFCLLHADHHREHDVYISIHDLDLFLISQKFPLYYYPTYALRALSSSLPTREQVEQSAALSALAQAHSRIVLLLQSMVHRSAVPINPEPREQLSSLPLILRQLTFPAPLSYHPPQLKDSLPKIQEPSRPSFTSNRRLSLFRTNTTTPPPPAEPRALKGYTNSWRSSLFHHRRHSSSDMTPSPLRPRRRDDSADSATSTTSTASPLSVSRSSTPTPPTSSPSSSPGPPSPSMASSSVSFATSPHSLSFATSRTRAPVLRVYVPCTELSDDSNSVLLCEGQLLQSGLWSHLSAGDIICNLGYVPADSEFDDASNLSASFNSDTRSSQHEQKWLIFNGSFLVPFTPGAFPLPLEDPLSLPSPFYYAHILPASPLANPVFVIPSMPMPNFHSNADAPVMMLQLLSTKVPSPPSPSGIAVAKKYMWTATVERKRCEWNDDRCEEDGGMGDGWYGNWVLEAEGTPEGRQMLLDWLGGGYVGPPREWELVRERSGVGKKEKKGTIWLKLLHSRDTSLGSIGHFNILAHH